jgi:iron complex transport system substrate-binding protein
MDARHVRIYGSPGLFHDVLERIGLANAWTERSSEWGLQTVAIEELSRIESADARLIAFDPVPPDVLPRLRRSPLWQSLPIARPGHFHVLPPALMFGMVNEAMRFAGLVTRLMESEA